MQNGDTSFLPSRADVYSRDRREPPPSPGGDTDGFHTPLAPAAGGGFEFFSSAALDDDGGLPNMEESVAMALEYAGARVPPDEQIRTWDDEDAGAMRMDRLSNQFMHTDDYNPGGPIDRHRDPSHPELEPAALRKAVEWQRHRIDDQVEMRRQKVHRFMVIVMGRANSSVAGAQESESSVAPLGVFLGLETLAPISGVPRQGPRTGRDDPVGAVQHGIGGHRPSGELPVAVDVSDAPPLTDADRRRIATFAAAEQQLLRWTQESTVTGIKWYGARYIAAVEIGLADVIEQGRHAGRHGNNLDGLTVDNMIFDVEQVMRKFGELCAIQTNLIRYESGTRATVGHVAAANERKRARALLWFRTHLLLNGGSAVDNVVSIVNRVGEARGLLGGAPGDVGDGLFRTGVLPYVGGGAMPGRAVLPPRVLAGVYYR